MFSCGRFILLDRYNVNILLINWYDKIYFQGILQNCNNIIHRSDTESKFSVTDDKYYS